MLRIPRDCYTYRFAADVRPVGEINPGERVTFETWDASTGRALSPASFLSYITSFVPGKVNPAAGPVYVHGAESGDGLAVTIEAIDLVSPGTIGCAAGGGLMHDGIDEPSAVLVEVDGGELIFDGRLRIPARPMIGVIGTAPAEGEQLTAVPGPIGGNLDCNIIRQGTTIHLPVHVPGALLALGDIHASMGDGEVTGGGIEMPANVRVRVELVKRPGWEWPWLQVGDILATFGYAPTFDAAGQMAVERMARLLVPTLGVNQTTAYILIGAIGDLHVGQSAALPSIDETAYVVVHKPTRQM
jgi:amidase